MTAFRLPSTRLARAGLLVLLVVLLAIVALGRAAAPATAKDSGSGWLRLAHLSPDTPSVNVSLTSFGDSRTMVRLTDVGYGDVSAYQKVPSGRYVATMTPAGGTDQSTPSITQAVTVADGRAYTVAAVGDNANLRGTVLDDDLRTPAAGSAKVRLLSAAVSSPTTTVTALGGPVLAKDAAFGSSTGYATIEAGVWTVRIDPAMAAPVTTEVTAKPGTVSTIVLLDAPNGTVTAKVVQDAAASPKAPKKGTGVDTGAGGTATSFVGEER